MPPSATRPFRCSDQASKSISYPDGYMTMYMLGFGMASSAEQVVASPYRSGTWLKKSPDAEVTRGKSLFGTRGSTSPRRLAVLVPFRGHLSSEAQGSPDRRDRPAEVFGQPRERDPCFLLLRSHRSRMLLGPA